MSPRKQQKQAVQDVTVYEHPLNERIRSFLRLEFLFDQADFYARGTSVWNNRATLNSIIEIQSQIGRSDMKTELLKELERHTANLARLEQNPNIDRRLLAEILDELDMLIDRLYNSNQPIGHALNDNEFLNSFKQRSAIPGGSCAFDLPGLHAWLQKPIEERNQILAGWLASFDLVRHAIGFLLRLIRDSAIEQHFIAEKGFFQQNMDPAHPCQLLRISLPASTQAFPEISAGKHRFTMRFMVQGDYNDRPKQTSEDVSFGLTCCLI